MKKIIITISCICTLCAFVVLAYFVFTYQSVADYLENGQTAMQAGDMKTAEKNFLEVIKQDKTNEAAYKALAEIAEKDKRKTWAARYWGIAARLNPLSNEIRNKYINSLLEANRYHAIIEQLKDKKTANLSNIELYALTKANFFINTATKTKRLLTVLLKKFPKDPKVTLLHARILLSSQDFQEAKRKFTSLRDCSNIKIRTNALIGLGHTEIALKKNKKASTYYQKAVKTSPDSMEVLMILANYNLSMGNQKIAKSQYETLHKNLPENIIVTIKLAEIYAKDKNTVAINKLLTHIKTNNQTAIAAKYYLRSLLAYIENNPEKVKENLHLCKIFAYRPLYAYLQFEEILSSNDTRLIGQHVKGLLKINNSLTARTDLCKQIEKTAIENFKKNKFKTTAALAAIMQNLLPQKPSLTHLAMVCAYNLQKWEKAISEANRFNKMSPNTLDYLSIKGRSLLYLNEAEEALPMLKKLSVLTPKKPEVWLWLAQAYQLLGKQKKIEANIKRMLQLANNSHSVIDPAVSFFLSRNNTKIINKIVHHLQSSKEKIFRAMAWSIKAQLAEKNKKWQDAVKYLTKAYELEKSIDILLYISDIYLKKKKHDNALKYIYKVLKDNPDSPKALFREAVIFQELENYEKASKLYRNLLKKYPKWSLVLVNLSYIMASEGKIQEALNLAQKAQKEASSWPPARLCLGLRELDCKNYTSALKIFESLLAQEPDNKIVKNAIPRCLVPIIKEKIKNKSFIIAKLRLEKLRKITPNSSELDILEKLILSEEKAAKTPAKNKLL